MKIFTISNKIIRNLIVAIVWIALWQIVAVAVNKEILIVSPFGVLKTFYYISNDISFWQTIIMSLFRIMEGWTIAVIVGIVVATLTCVIPFAYDFLYPVISTIKATPVASFIILALVWIKTDYVPVFASFLMVFPLIWSSIATGVKNTDSKFLEMAKVFDFGIMKKIKLIYIPSAMPHFMTACTTGVGLAWKSGIAAEVICTPVFSIGRQLNNSKVYLETPELFMWTAVVIIMSVIIEKIFVMVLNIVGRKYNV